MIMIFWKVTTCTLLGVSVFHRKLLPLSSRCLEVIKINFPVLLRALLLFKSGWAINSALHKSILLLRILTKLGIHLPYHFLSSNSLLFSFFFLLFPLCSLLQLFGKLTATRIQLVGEVRARVIVDTDRHVIYVCMYVCVATCMKFNNCQQCNR